MQSCSNPAVPEEERRGVGALGQNKSMCVLFLFSCGTSMERAIYKSNKHSVMETPLHPQPPLFSQTHPAVNPQIESFILKGRVLRIRSPLRCSPLSTALEMQSPAPPTSRPSVPANFSFTLTSPEHSPQTVALDPAALSGACGNGRNPRPHAGAS